MQEDFICRQSDDLTSSNEYFCLQVKIQHAQASSKSPTTSHLITNLAYKLKPQHTRNQYLRARLDTCADVNIMPASVYKLVFHDPELQKLAPSKLEIGTYTTDTVKLVGSCVFYLVHPNTKHLQEVTFYVASNNGSVLLSCVTTLALGLIQPCIRLDYLPPRASLITSSADHPKKTKSQVSVHVSKQEFTVSNQKDIVPKKHTTLQTDASVKGLGACLLQDDRPLYFASKDLADAQKGYVAIELKSLVVARAMEKFHHLLYASHFLLETDQKPLEAILSKSINQATPRSQRILIRTFAYHFTVKYIPGSTIQLADCFS